MCYSHQHLNEPHYWPTFCTISLFRILWPNFALYFIGCLTLHFFSPSPYLFYRTLSLEQKIVDFCACRWCSICASLLKHAIGTDISLWYSLLLQIFVSSFTFHWSWHNTAEILLCIFLVLHLYVVLLHMSLLLFGMATCLWIRALLCRFWDVRPNWMYCRPVSCKACWN